MLTLLILVFKAYLEIILSLHIYLSAIIYVDKKLREKNTQFPNECMNFLEQTEMKYPITEVNSLS